GVAQIGVKELGSASVELVELLSCDPGRPSSHRDSFFGYVVEGALKVGAEFDSKSVFPLDGVDEFLDITSRYVRLGASRRVALVAETEEIFEATLHDGKAQSGAALTAIQEAS